MIIGRGVFGYKDNPFKISPGFTNFYRMEINNAIFDEIKIDATVDETYNSTKDEWNYDTRFLAKFQNSLEAGDVDNQGIPIQYILFQKRRKDTEYEWTDVATFPYTSLQKIYSVVDTYVENFQEYEYAICPLTSSVIGNRVTVDITPSFDGCFITNKDFNLHLLFNKTMGDFTPYNPSTIYEPLGENPYPITSYSNIKYFKTNVKALIVSDETNLNQANLNPHTEKIYRHKILDFLNNHKPKLFRTSSGEYIMVMTTNPKYTPENSVLEGGIGDISFDITECGDPTNKDEMTNNGF